MRESLEIIDLLFAIGVLILKFFSLVIKFLYYAIIDGFSNGPNIYTYILLLGILVTLREIAVYVYGIGLYPFFYYKFIRKNLIENSSPNFEKVIEDLKENAEKFKVKEFLFTPFVEFFRGNILFLESRGWNSRFNPFLLFHWTGHGLDFKREIIYISTLLEENHLVLLHNYAHYKVGFIKYLFKLKQKILPILGLPLCKFARKLEISCHLLANIIFNVIFAIVFFIFIYYLLNKDTVSEKEVALITALIFVIFTTLEELLVYSWLFLKIANRKNFFILIADAIIHFSLIGLTAIFIYFGFYLILKIVNG